MSATVKEQSADGLSVRVEAFEGPLPLLCHLIEKSEINIHDIPISELTTQYLQYLDSLGGEDMDSMSEFILMAATLLEIKSRMLLPNPPKEEGEEEEDPRAELVRRLLEYKRFQEAAQFLQENEGADERCYFKTADSSLPKELVPAKPVLSEVLSGITLDSLYAAYTEVLKRRELKIDKVRAGFNAVTRDMFTIEEKTEYILDLLNLRSIIEFSEIFRAKSMRMEIVVTFLALLELIKQRLVNISGDGVFDSIKIMRNNQGNV